MRVPRLVLLATLAVSTLPASAHRVDEYLQAAILETSRAEVRVYLRLTPGTTVAPAILGVLDGDHDGELSPEEIARYVQRAAAAVSLSIDGSRVPLHVLSAAFAPVQELREGSGEIQITLTAPMPAPARHHTLVFENRFEPVMSVYLANALVPSEPSLTIDHQQRNANQSRFELTLTDAGSPAGASPESFLRRGWLLLLILLAPLPLVWLLWNRLRKGAGSRRN